MDLSKTVYAIIGVLVAVLVIATVAVPIVDESSKSISTSVNNANAVYAVAMTDDTLTLEVVNKAASEYKLNGVTVHPTEDEYNSFYLIAGKNVFMRLYSDGIYARHNAQSLSIQDGYVFSASGGTWTLKNGDSVIATDTYDVLYYPSEGGTYGIYRSASEWIDKGAQYLAWKEGLTTSTEAPSTVTGPITVAWGTYGGDSTISSWSSETTKVNSTLSINVSEEGDLADKVSFSVVYNGNTTQLATVIAPISYHVITEENSSQIALLGAVVLMLFIVPVMMAVRMISGRDE